FLPRRRDESSPDRWTTFMRSPRAADPRWAYAAGLLIAFDMSLGFNGVSYGALYHYVLPFRGLRIPARMGIMVGFSLAVLAGFGIDRLARARPSASRRR